jgi:hypothetical protein
MVASTHEFLGVGLYSLGEDETWIPDMAQEGWIVLTADRGKGGRGKGEKLPVLCRAFGMTHILMSGSLHRRTSIQKVTAILEVWDNINELPEQPKGSAWSLRLTQSGKAVLACKLDPG